jgi:TM2 domain-containing membrane protein YozV
MAFCQNCGAALSDGSRFCSSCGHWQPSAGAAPAPAPPSAVIPEKYGIAALLSFFLPGLGQVVKGQVLKAIVIWLGMIVFVVLSFVVIGLPLLLVLWLWQIYDAYNSPQTA